MVSIWVTGGIALLAIAVSILTSLWVGSINAAKFRGSIEATVKTKFEAVGSDIAKLQRGERDLWKKTGAIDDDVSEVRDRVSKVEGRLNGRAAGAH